MRASGGKQVQIPIKVVRCRLVLLEVLAGLHYLVTVGPGIEGTKELQRIDFHVRFRMGLRLLRRRLFSRVGLGLGRLQNRGTMRHYHPLSLGVKQSLRARKTL